MRTAKMNDVAPMVQASGNVSGEVWEVALEHVEPHTGRLLDRPLVQADALGPSKVTFDERNVLYSKLRPYLNKVVLPDSFGVATSELVPLRPDPERLDRRFLAHYLRSPGFVGFAVSRTAGANLPRLSMRAFRDHAVPLPPLTEQRAAVAVLDRVEAARDKARLAAERLDAFLAATFDEMFGDPVSNPQGCKVVRVGDIAEVSTGATPSREHVEYYGGAIPWVKTGEVEGVITQTEELITEKGLANSNCKVFPERTLLIAMYGQGKTRGKSAMLGIAAATNQACAAILPSGAFVPEFLAFQLGLLYEHMRSFGRGGNQPNLNLSIVKRLQVILPAFGEQEQFAEVVRHADTLRARLGVQAARLDGLYAALADRAFRGELAAQPVFE